MTNFSYSYFLIPYLEFREFDELGERKSDVNAHLVKNEFMLNAGNNVNVIK